MMQITRAEIIAVTLLIRISLTVPPASLNFAIRLSSLMLKTDHNQRPAGKTQILPSGRLPDGYPGVYGSATLRHAAMPQRPDFSREVFQANCPRGRHPTSRKEKAGSVRRLLI